MVADICDIKEDPWPGRFSGTGTCISFPCSRALFNTSGKGYPGHDVSFIVLVQCIREELAVIYAPYLRNGYMINIYIHTAEGKRRLHQVRALEPVWTSTRTVDQGTCTLDLGAGPVRIRYHFGEIDNHPGTARYFRKSFSNAGVMVYENGRMIEHHIFSAIWGKEHPQHNGFLAVIELDVPDGSTNNALPPPVPTKDKLFYGDYRLAALYDWIHNHCPKPSIYKGTIGPKPEILRCEQLADKLREMCAMGDITREEFLSDSAAIRNEISVLELQIKDLYMTAEQQSAAFSLDFARIRETLDRWIDFSDSTISDALIE